MQVLSLDTPALMRLSTLGKLIRNGISLLLLMFVTATSPFALELSQESAVERVSGTSVDMRLRTSNYWDRINSYGVFATHWVTATFDVSDGVCKDPKILSAFAVDKDRIFRALVVAGKEFEHCEPSYDGSGLHGNRLLLVVNLMGIGEGYFIENSGGFLSAPQRSGNLISGDTIWSIDGLEESLRECEGRCTPLTVLGVMFAKATYFDSVNMQVTANLWRYEALKSATVSQALQRKYRNQIDDHVKRLFNYAVKTHQVGLALNTESLSRELLGERETTDHIRSEVAVLKRQLEELKVSLEIVIPLSSQSPYHDNGGASVVFLAQRDFSLSEDSGDLSAAYLKCSDGKRRYDAQLQIDSKTRWVIPKEYETCKLFLFGSHGGKVHLSQFPTDTNKVATLNPLRTER